MIDHIIEHKRCAVFAAMGSGKSGATLHALAGIGLLDEAPALILGPKRVAVGQDGDRDDNGVWAAEAAKWDSFSEEVVPICGSLTQRIQATQRKALFYSTNYEQLPWLVKFWGRNWPYRTIVADEATKLKGFRLRQGGQRTAALGKVAWSPVVERFIELTGTPAPNGLKDTWGQLWFLDRGERLGRTYDAFSQRWFQRAWDGYGIEPLSFAQDQIQELIGDLCITIDPRDYGVDVGVPIETEIMVDLPDKAMDLYREMEKKMFIEIEHALGTHEIEAVNAASRTNKCLQLCVAGYTDTLTDRGWVPLAEVREDDRLWDGGEWISHDGLIAKGETLVVNVDGVHMTPGHEVLTVSGWAPAWEILHDDASPRLDRAAVRLPGGFASRRRRWGWATCAMALSMRLWPRSDTPFRLSPSATSTQSEKLRLLARQHDARYDRRTSLANLEPDEVPMLQPERQGFQELWGPRYRGVRTLGQVLRRFLGRHAERLLGRFRDRPDRREWRLQTGKLPLGGRNHPTQQPAEQRLARNFGGANDGGPGQPAFRGQAGHDPRAHPAGVAGGTTALAGVAVFDIMNCGPRNRFVVRGEGGKLLIVHNCNGFIYGEDKEVHAVHHAKLDALESIVEEANGMPVLVSTQFVEDQVMLKRAFPKAKRISETTEKEWNAGRVPMMLVHPESAGHGLNLQHGSNILVDYSSGWNLEADMQVIERIGPMRQFQAGLDRPVYRYRIMARGTADEMVRDRRTSKRSVQDVLIEAMKRRGGMTCPA